jgi:hypothetical protein
MLMLLGAVFSEVLRAISALVVELATFRGSVGPWLSPGDLRAPDGWAGGGCEEAVPGATDGWVGVCCETLEVSREWTGTFAVLDAGAGRV